LIALFVGWRMKPEVLASELSFGHPWLFTSWIWMLRVIAPLAILGILINGLR
jgi:NSS family neurotransmitter:Na+ symporter